MRFWKNTGFNICILLNSLMAVVLIAGTRLHLPVWLEVAGRMHPLVLHFPIALIVIALIWELRFARRVDTQLYRLGDWILLSAALAAVLAALMGIFLSAEEGYDLDKLAWHKWTGVGVSVLTLLWYGFRNVLRPSPLRISLVGLTTLAALTIAGHQGASVTHGEDFLWAPLSKTKGASAILIEDAIAWTHLIEPLLRDKCMSCHNARKSKGDLAMDTPEGLLKGGKSGKLWDASVAGEGLLMQRIRLPIDDEKHMAPKGKPQLTANEIQLLAAWIHSGADFTRRVSDYPEGDSLRTLAAGVLSSLEDATYTFAAADPGAVSKLNTDYRMVQPVALNSPALGVQFFSASAFQSQQISELSGIAKQIVSLQLNRMPVKDEDLRVIGTFENLRKLNLSFTQITGQGLEALSKLNELRHLSLSGTPVTAAQLQPLSRLPALSALYLWQTGVSDADLPALRKSFPNAVIETGYRGDTVVAHLNKPLIQGDQQVFTDSVRVLLKHYIQGVQMRYTLDGTDPDSLQSAIYSGGITITRPVLLKVKAFLPGWVSSEIAAQNYYKTGFIPDSVRLVAPPNPQYSGNGRKTLFDAEKSNADFRSGKWLGYRENDMVTMVSFNQPVTLSSVSFSAFIDIASYIMPPQQLEVWGGADEQHLSLLSKINPAQPVKLAPVYTMGFDCSFGAREVRVLKLVAKPLGRLPAWHPGKGDKAWVFMDEVFLN